MQRKQQYYENLRNSTKGDLLIKDYVYTLPRVGKIWECLCSCGKTVYLSTSEITGKGRFSCPECAAKQSKERSIQQLTKHGEHGTRLYNIWRAMISRCKYRGDTNYKHYGGRGITVCPEWRDDYMSFRDWAMSNGYSDSLTIDRINVNGNYEPNNCRWATIKEQANNKSNTVCIVVDGVKKSQQQWSELIGVSHTYLSQIRKNGKDVRTYIQNKLREANT